MQTNWKTWREVRGRLAKAAARIQKLLLSTPPSVKEAYRQIGSVEQQIAAARASIEEYELETVKSQMEEKSKGDKISH